MRALLLALPLLAFPSSVQADCEPYPITEHSPTGIVGCVVYGQGTASMWGGPGVARNDCVYPWTDCQLIAIRSLQTGIVIVVQPRMYGDLFLGDSDPSIDRIVDLDPGAVAALGLDPSEGLWKVEIHPVGDGELGNPVPPAPVLPDTSTEAP